jgi:hypothetical protein
VPRGGRWPGSGRLAWPGPGQGAPRTAGIEPAPARPPAARRVPADVASTRMPGQALAGQRTAGGPPWVRFRGGGAGRCRCRAPAIEGVPRPRFRVGRGRTRRPPPVALSRSLEAVPTRNQSRSAARSRIGTSGMVRKRCALPDHGSPDHHLPDDDQRARPGGSAVAWHHGTMGHVRAGPAVTARGRPMRGFTTAYHRGARMGSRPDARGIPSQRGLPCEGVGKRAGNMKCRGCALLNRAGGGQPD